MRLRHPPDRSVWTQQVVLTHHLVERGRPQTVGERSRRFGLQPSGFEQV
jgi:hypothetical protein